MSYFAQTPKATAELVNGLVGVVLMTALAVLILAYGPDLWNGLVDGMAAAPARISAVVRGALAVGTGWL